MNGFRLCDHCGKPIDLSTLSGPALPKPHRLWCSEACRDAWIAQQPAEESARWVAASEWTPEQKALVQALLGHGEDC
jgi:hypothetical protein